ncbi:energy transducer TonB [Bernardetia sp. OM2101]|uniref:energy transducer TonB n=1 Tax=Bernardetia sp. OM2101 TaxID=3344876 RepID=UPI0035D09483
MNSFNLNFIAISCMAIFFVTGFSKNYSSDVVSDLPLKNYNHLVLSDSAKSDSTKKDSANVAQLIEVGSEKNKTTETELKPQNELDKFAEDSIFLITDKPVEYIEGKMSLFYKFVAYNINYPEEARRKKQQDKIYVRFVVNKDGSVSKAESVRGEYDILKQEAERVVSLTKWIPAQINGQNVRSLMTIPIIFKLDVAQTQTKKQNTDEEVNIAEVDEVANHKDGLDGLYKHISQNLDYPKSAKKLGEQGKVIVEFVVETDGSLSDFKVLQSVSTDCDNEAIRVIKSTSPWIPAQKDGQAVKTRISMPLVFKLD